MVAGCSMEETNIKTEIRLKDEVVSTDLISNKIKTENWNGYEIRFVEKDGEWWSVAQDIAKALNFRDAFNATAKLNKKYKGTAKVSTLNGLQEMIILNEKGIYRIVMRSNKPEAEAFQDWVYEMLSELRKQTGLEGFQVFRMLDKEHQKEAMKRLHDSLHEPIKVDYIKANTIANKAVSNKYGFEKMVKKPDMTAQMLEAREKILDDTVELMTVNDKYKLGISVSEKIYENITKEGA